MLQLNDDRIIHRPQRAPHPLGPLIRYKRSANRVASRLIGLIVVAGLATPLVVAVSLTPEASGFGRHRQFGHPSCTMLAVTGYPCPTCGMTRAFGHAVRGRWIRAFHAQPMGWLLAVAAMLGASAALVTVATGGTWIVNWYRIPPTKVVLGILLLSAAAWGYTILVVRSAAGGGEP